MMLLSPHIPHGNGICHSSSSNSSTSSSDTKSVNAHLHCQNNLGSISSPPPYSPASCLDFGRCVASCVAYGRVCPLTAQTAGRAASRKMESIVENSPLFGGLPPSFPKTAPPEDLILGEKLGEGGFCTVHACTMRNEPLDESCAVKFLRREITAVRQNFEHGAADLATEAFFLARLQHPNIVRLRAVAAGSVESNIVSGRETGFFLVVDRLVETLGHRIRRWKQQTEEMPHNLFHRMSKEYKDKQKALLKERLQVAVQIAEVCSYLHGLNVAYRDLKPDNIGFDRDGTLKLFDFGLCKEEKQTIAFDGKYRMTGHTGSRRYMAPEVAKNQPYDKSVDVYSFGVLLWELCSLEKPFSAYCSKKHMTQVILGGERPKMDHAHTAFWPVALQTMLCKCWSSHPEDRPSFDAIKATLEEVMAELSMVHNERARARSIGSKEDDSKKSPTSPGKKIHPLSNFGGLRARSLGLKRSQS